MLLIFTYVITVWKTTGISSKPQMDIPPLTEKLSATLSCEMEHEYCSGPTPKIEWKGKAADNHPTLIGFGGLSSTGVFSQRSFFSLIFDSTYHNTVLTCMIVYMDDIITEQHVTLIVKCEYLLFYIELKL